MSGFQLDKTFDLRDLPGFFNTDDRKRAAEELVKDFTGSVTFVMIGHGLEGQTRSIKSVRDGLLALIIETGFDPTDFRIDCNTTEGGEPIWRSIEDASDNAIKASYANDRFWA